ncbi:MAG TPA: amino acid adenylation domain-containing protein, partial [Campylobacterales bacterium]|nr:amino acid adenylation domain-containing protein [Campylobacterales bacterium]
MVKDIYKLTSLQEGILFHTLAKEEKEAPYFEQIGFDIKGVFDNKLFQESWNVLIQRHDIFRTIFVYGKTPKPRQVVLKKGEVQLSYEEISSLAQEEQASYIEKFQQEDRQAYFELSKSNPLRLKVFKIGEEHYRIIFSNHHILIDGWSLGIVFKELFTIYSALKASKPIELGMVHPYSDYIKWLNQQEMNSTKSFWENYLEGYETDVLIPKKVDALKNVYERAETSLVIGKEQTVQLQRLTQKYAVTMNVLIETLWAIVLAKYNDCDDVVFGSTVSGRTEHVRGIEKMVGLFINTIPVRVQFSKNETLLQSIQRVMNQSIEAKDHHHYSLAEIQNLTALKGDLIKQLMVFENYPISTEHDSSLGFELSNIEHFSETNYDLLIMIHALETITISFQYNGAVYSTNTLRNIKGSLEKLIDDVLKNPETLVADLDIISQEEYQLLESFNQTEQEYPKDKTIIELFEEQVARTPDNIAVVYEDREFTYAQINQKANSLGAYLRENYAVKANTIVPIMLDRSEWMIIAILGVLKAGGAYLPIDPEYPKDRINYMLEDSQAKLILCETVNLAQTEAYNKLDIDVLDIQSLAKKNNIDSIENLEIITNSSNLAYVIYTSGSTGLPKGVMLTQKSVTSFTANLKHRFNIQEQETLYAITTIAFDISVLELISSLLKNLKVIIASSNNIEKNVEEIKNNSIDVIQTTPTRYKAFLDLDETALNGVQKLLIGGESLKPDILLRLRTLNCELYNVYGPTEATIWSTVKRVDNDKLDIGKPLLNEMTYILNKEQKEQPLGSIGELYIGGDGLAKGYLNKPELTEKVFIVHEKLGRIYKTGDIARYREDGNIEYLGRV